MKVTFDVDSITKIEKKKTIIDNVFGFTNEERNLLNHLFIIFLERIAVDDVAKSFILDIYNLVQNKIPDIIKSNIEIKPSINLSLKFI